MYQDYPPNIHESLALQYFVNGIRNPEIQIALSLADKNVEFALLYAVKCEIAKQASGKEHHGIILAFVQKPDSELKKNV